MPERPPTYGAPDAGLDAHTALLAEIRRTAGAVDWLAGEVAALEPEALTRGTRFVRTTTDEAGKKSTVAEAGVARHELLQLYLEERRHLHALCRDALAAEQRATPKDPPGPAGSWPKAI